MKAKCDRMRRIAQCRGVVQATAAVQLCAKPRQKSKMHKETKTDTHSEER